MAFNKNDEQKSANVADNDDASSNLKYRAIWKKFKAHSQKEGAGFIVHRPIGGADLSPQESDPFLMLDELGPKMYKKNEFEGAPWHPHRGFDTVMYMKHGEGTHQDSMGTKGRLRKGDVQWMTAGSGIIHDEGKNHPGGLLHGFQMWGMSICPSLIIFIKMCSTVNLPKTHKMCDPQYQQITAKNFPFLQIDKGTKCKVIAGEIKYLDDQTNAMKIFKSPLKPIVPINYFDIEMDKGSNVYKHIIPANMKKILKTAIVYVYNGQGFVNDKANNKLVAIKSREVITFGDDGNCIEFTSAKDSNFSFLLLLGKPIKEPIAWKGPFVMNTIDEIKQCEEDWRNEKLATVKGKSTIY